ncbi:MAG: hypothetical protein JWN86_3256 [Planctomycetota bacterium]|nr:hypothetical protein [Planctomycetota bacterium]
MTKPIKVKFQNWDCDLIKHRYANGRTALELVDSQDGERVATATLNLPNEPPAPDEVVIKSYSENETMLETLVNAGIVEPTGRVCVSGFIQAPVCRVKAAL